MCVILFKPFGVQPLCEEWLENATDANGDGWGYVVRDLAGAITTHHGFAFKELKDAMPEYGAAHEVLFHARWSTHGTLTEDNLHPFALRAKPDEAPFAWFVHNGVVHVPIIDKNKSDTFHLARQFETLYGEETLALIKRPRWVRKFLKRVGDSNKFAFMTHDGVTLLNGEAGVWKDGVWASNHSAFESPWAPAYDWRAGTLATRKPHATKNASANAYWDRLANTLRAEEESYGYDDDDRATLTRNSYDDRRAIELAREWDDDPSGILSTCYEEEPETIAAAITLVLARMGNVQAARLA